MTHLLEQGWQVVAAGNADDYVQRLTESGVTFHEVSIARGGLAMRQDWNAFRQLRQLYQEYQPELIHHFQPKPVVLGGRAARSWPAATVVNTITGLGHSFIAGGVSRWLATTGFRMSLGRAVVTIFQNPDDLALFVRQRLLSERATELIVSSGVDLERFCENGRGCAGAGLQVLMLSRLLWEKGVAEYVEAARICKQHFPQARFQLAGELDTSHPTAVPQEYINRQTHDGTIEYLGYLANVERILPQVDVVVLPSYREGVPRVLLEASACGVPCVTTDVPGCRHAVADDVNGILVPERDPVSLAHAINSLLGDERRRRRMGDAGRERAEREFDVRIITERHLELYGRLGLPVD